MEMSECHLDNKFASFGGWYPNLRHLEMTDCSVDESALNVRFSRLEYLRLNIGRGLHIENAMNVLQANPQLQILRICCHFNLSLSTIRDAISQHSLLTKLKVFGCEFFVGADDLTRRRTSTAERADIGWFYCDS